MNAPLECVPDLQIPEVAPILLLPNGYHQPPVKPLPPIISGHDLLHQELVLPDELVEGMIHRGTQTLVAGCSKSYKTWILMNLAASVATGTDFWNRKTVQDAIEQRRVISRARCIERREDAVIEDLRLVHSAVRE